MSWFATLAALQRRRASAIRIQGLYRRLVARNKRALCAQEKEKQVAATKIQSLQRGAATRIQRKQHTEATISLNNRIAELEEVKRVEDDRLKSMAKAETRRLGVVERLVKMLDANVNSWYETDKQLVVDEQRKQIEVERLIKIVAKAQTVYQEKERVARVAQEEADEIRAKQLEQEAESKRFKSLYEEDKADAELAQVRSSQAAEVAESVHQKFLTAQAKLTETRAERISLETHAERLRDFSMRDRADAKQMQEDLLEAEVKACKKEEERVWEVMEAHRQEEARVTELAHNHHQKSDELAAAAEATKQRADLLAAKAARLEKTRREEEARVQRLTNTCDEAKAALKRVQSERRSGEAKAKGMQAARADAETKSAQAAREYEQRRAARAPANELLAQELAELRLALLAAEGGRLGEMHQHEDKARSVQAQRRGAEAEAAATEIVALQHRELEALRHADHAEVYGRHDDAAHYLQQAAELRNSQAAESQIVYADKIAQLEHTKRVEDDQLASMAQAEARRAGIATRLIGIFDKNVKEWRQKDEKLAADEKLKSLEVERLANQIAEAKVNMQEDEPQSDKSRKDKSNLKHLQELHTAAKAALERVQSERRSGEAKAKGMQAARADAETKSAQAAREYEQRRAARAPANELLAQELAELRLALLAAEGGRLGEMHQHEDKARSVQAQRRGAEAEAAATEIVALQHRELEALRHADHAEVYGRHDDAAHYLQQAAELRQGAQGLAIKIELSDPEDLLPELLGKEIQAYHRWADAKDADQQDEAAQFLDQARHHHEQYKHTSAVKIQAIVRRSNVRRQLGDQIGPPKAPTSPADTAVPKHKIRTPSAKKGEQLPELLRQELAAYHQWVDAKDAEKQEEASRFLEQAHQYHEKYKHASASKIQAIIRRKGKARNKSSTQPSKSVEVTVTLPPESESSASSSETNKSDEAPVDNAVDDTLSSPAAERASQTHNFATPTAKDTSNPSVGKAAILRLQSAYRQRIARKRVAGFQLLRRHEVVAPGWERRLAYPSGQIFYYNPATGECMWQAPPLPKAETTEGSEPDASDKQLGNGWLQVWDAIHHAHFYVNDSAGISQWERPSEADQVDATKQPEALTDDRLREHGWTREWDPGQQMHFYHHAASGVSQWELPNFVQT